MKKYRIKEYRYEGDPMFIAQKKGIFGWSGMYDTIACHQDRCKEKLCKIIKYAEAPHKYHEVNCDDM